MLPEIIRGKPIKSEDLPDGFEEQTERELERARETGDDAGIAAAAYRLGIVRGIGQPVDKAVQERKIALFVEARNAAFRAGDSKLGVDAQRQIISASTVTVLVQMAAPSKESPVSLDDALYEGYGRAHEICYETHDLEGMLLLDATMSRLFCYIVALSWAAGLTDKNGDSLVEATDRLQHSLEEQLAMSTDNAAIRQDLELVRRLVREAQEHLDGGSEEDFVTEGDDGFEPSVTGNRIRVSKAELPTLLGEWTEALESLTCSTCNEHVIAEAKRAIGLLKKVRPLLDR